MSTKITKILLFFHPDKNIDIILPLLSKNMIFLTFYLILRGGNMARKTGRSGRIRATKLFLSAAGVSRELGLTCANQYEVDVKQACIESSLQKILPADSKKFDQIRPAWFAPLDRMDMVITDSGISGEWVQVMEQTGISVQTV
jgi:DeoR/GlpR family transcriptional regulator of sugar metabolism